jgi:hypothetical protein
MVVGSGRFGIGALRARVSAAFGAAGFVIDTGGADLSSGVSLTEEVYVGACADRS